MRFSSSLVHCNNLLIKPKTVLIALKHLYALVLWLQDDDDVYLYDDADRIKMQGRWVH